MIMEILPQIGLSAENPQGGLYIWAKVEDGDGDAYAAGALDEAHVSIAPGSAYGVNGAGYVRISLVTPQERLLEALERMRKWYQERN